MNIQSDVFDREYLPSDLYHREGQIEELRRGLIDHSPSSSARLVTIFGPSGSGKTTLAKYFTRRYGEQSEPLKTGYANCIDDKTPTQILRTLLRQTGLAPTSPPGSASGCLAVLNKTDDPVQVIIDEIGYLGEPEIIKSLCRVRRVGVILIGIKENRVLAGLPPDIRNRVQSAPTVRLSRFNDEELEAILWGRIDLGLPPEVVTPSAVREIAAHANGDAYVAISILRECVREIDFYRHCEIDQQLVGEVKDSVPLARTERDVEHLGTHPHLLYDLIKQAGSITAGELKRRYEATIPDARSDRMRREYLGELKRYNMIETTGKGRGTRYHSVDR